MNLIKLALTAGLLTLLAGCGLKYDLYMPEDGANSSGSGNFLIYSSESAENSATNTDPQASASADEEEESTQAAAPEEE